MGVFSWFARRKHLKRLIVITAAIAALATACKNKSEQFVDMVDPQDKVVAAALIREPQKKSDWQKASKALDDARVYLDFRGHLAYKWLGSMPVFEGDAFFSDLSDWFKQILKGKDFKSFCADWVKPIEDVGLGATAKKNKQRLLEYFLEFDHVVSLKINNHTGHLLKKKPEEIRKYIQEMNVIRLMQQALKEAKKAGFTKTVAAIENALINIRGAMAK